MGSGQQYVPWVHVVDVARAIEMIVRASDGDPLGCGAVNVAGPSPATNADVMRALAVARKRIGCRIVVPQQPMEMILGESACVIFDSERLLPGKLKSAGFEFLHETVLSALAADPYA
jgi:NAD dependent epimerase/dehydratase family enzyme